MIFICDLLAERIFMSQKHAKQKRQPKPHYKRYTLTNVILNTYLLVALTVFPLFVNLMIVKQFPFISFQNGYMQIRHQKYFFFLVISSVALVAEIMLLFTKTAEERNPDHLSSSQFFSTLSFTDWAAVAFALTCAVSTLISAHVEVAVKGESPFGGRNNGLILMLFYVALYFLITRCFYYKEYVFTAMAAVNGAICLLAVLNGFHIDPLGMFVPFKGVTSGPNAHIYNEFMTTIGNKNMFASHICVTLPVTISLFVFAKELWRKALYLLCTAIGAMAIVVCDSDSVVLGMGAFIAVFFVAYIRHPERLKRFLLALTVMLLSFKLLRLFSALGGDNYKELSAIPYKIMLSDKTFIAIIVLAVLTAALYALSFFKKDTVLPKAVPIALGSLFALAAVAGVGVIVYYSVFDTKTDLGEMERVLRFNDAWGTHRGIMWNRALRAFSGFSPMQKLFGTGPETFCYTFMPYNVELLEYGDSSTDAAHNEYINYLCNIGILGLASYLAFTGGAMARAFRAAKREPLALVFASAAVAYMAQAIVNIAVPIAMPLFIIFTALCEATARQSKETV